MQYSNIKVKFSSFMIIMMGLLTVAIAYLYITPQLSTGIYFAVLAFLLITSICMLALFFITPGWRLQLAILGGLSVLTGISYRFAFNATMEQEPLLVATITLTTLVIVAIFSARFLPGKLSQKVRILCNLSGLGALIIGSFLVFPQATLHPIPVLLWCLAIIFLLFISLTGIFQDILYVNKTGDRRSDTRRIVALSSATVFTTIAILPVLVISSSLITRIFGVE